MHWPRNPVAASLQRLSTLAGPMAQVRLTAPVEPIGAMLLRVRWPMGGESPDPDLVRATGLKGKIASWERPADSTVIVPVSDVATSDQWMYETAWALGAGYLHRWMHAPRIQVWENEGAILIGALVGLRHDWGVPTYEIMGEPLEEGPALPDMVLEAARHGYWSWECNVGYRAAEWRPGAASDWQAEWAVAGDAHEADGSRAGPPPDRSAWPPEWIAHVAASYEHLTDPEAAVLGIACDLVNRRYEDRPA